jgi:predicted glycosyltransferase
MKPALLFYCQHSLGLGHLVRSWAIADALSSDFHVVFVSGGQPPEGLTPPAAIEMVMLPPVEQTVAGAIVSSDTEASVPDILQRRAELLFHTYCRTAPVVVLTELFPFGRAKFANEILPILAYALSGRRRPLVVCSLRDLLAGGRRNQQEHDERAKHLAEAYFDAILVHADPRLARLEETFKPHAPLQVPVVYTGFVSAASPVVRTPNPERNLIVVSAGGGRVGGPLFEAAVEAHALTPPAGRLPMRIVTGPFLPDAEYSALTARAAAFGDLLVERSVPTLRPLLEMAAVSVSQCGYNTALDLLQTRVPALVVPFAEGREDEQRARAIRLQALGALRVLDSAALTGARLAAEIAVTRAFTPSPIDFDMDGAAETRRAVTRLFEARIAPQGCAHA